MSANQTNQTHTAPKTCILMAGSSNLHLWPVSRINNPVQFQKTVGAPSPFQQAALALAAIPNLATLWVTVSAGCIDTARSQLKELDIAQPVKLLVEPVERGDLCALMAVALVTTHQCQGSCLIALDANNPPKDLACFHRLVGQLTNSQCDDESIIICCERASGNIVTPIYPGSALEHSHLFRMANEEDRKSPAHAYNGLVFIPSQNGVETLSRVAPRFQASCEKAIAAATDCDAGIWPDTNLWSALPTLEVTDLLNETLNNIALRPTDLKNAEPTNDTHTSDTLFFDNGHLVALADGIDVDVLTSADATLIKARNAPFDTEKMLHSLQLANRPELFDSMSHAHSWGHETLLERRADFSVQHIEIMAGSSIGEHFHNHRTETWHILSGSGEAKIDGQRRSISPGDVVKIPHNAIHSLKNTGQTTLFALEIRQGSFLSRVDIIETTSVRKRSGLTQPGSKASSPP